MKWPQTQWYQCLGAVWTHPHNSTQAIFYQSGYRSQSLSVWTLLNRDRDRDRWNGYSTQWYQCLGVVWTPLHNSIQVIIFIRLGLSQCEPSLRLGMYLFVTLLQFWPWTSAHHLILNRSILLPAVRLPTDYQPAQMARRRPEGKN